MRRRFRALLAGDEGTVLILVAFAIFALAAMAVLGVDIARLLVAKTQLQNASDAAALGGAGLFLEPAPDAGSIRARAGEVAKQNQAFEAAGDEYLVDEQIESILVDMTTQRVTVVTRSVVSQFFTRVIGGEILGPVRARAVATATEIARAGCLKPWSIPDRWDDASPIVGHASWRGNERWDHEEFGDANGDGYWNPGEPFVDGNQNGRYDAEFYDPLLTGYVASRDHGLRIALHAGHPHDAYAPGQYFAIDLPPDLNGPPDQGANFYRWNIENCNSNVLGPGDWVWTQNGRMTGPTGQGVRDLIARDPDSYWDESCECVQGSEFPSSPRIGLVPVHDPRLPLGPGRQQVKIVKIAAFFIEDVEGEATVIGRFLKTRAEGEPPPDGSPGAGFLARLSLVE